MDIRELRTQEDFECILRSTLSRGWEQQYEDSFRITEARDRKGQRWMVQPMLSAYYTANVVREGREFITDRFRHSPKRHRRAPQWVLGTLLGSGPGLRYGGQTAFWVSPSVPGAPHTVVIPGSRRVRIFDFRRHVTRALLKVGFSPSSVETEIEVRGRDTSGPFVSISEFDPNHQWFEEPIVPGFALPRCPPWMNRERLAGKAISLLQEWMAPTISDIDAGERAAELLYVISKDWPILSGRFDFMKDQISLDSLERLQEIAARLGRTTLATAHGDFQPGNILVEHPGSRVFIIDWEHSADRFRFYDALTYIVRARYGSGLDSRIGRFVAKGRGDGVHDFFPSLPNRQWRASATAFFLLEELERSVTDISSAPYSSPPVGFRTLCKELSAVIEHLDD